MTTTDMGLTGAQLQECLLCLLEGLHSIPGLTVPSLLLVALLSPSKYPSPMCNFRPYEVVAVSIFDSISLPSGVAKSPAQPWTEPCNVHQEWQLHMGVLNSL